MLDSLGAPIAHLDFETINPAIPVWDGCRPYDAVPVQFSVDVEPTRAGGRLRHVAWLAEGSGDPRAPLAHALVDAIRGARTILVYDAPFKIRYDTLEIGEGGEASQALESMLLRPETMTKAQRTRMRRALLAYCEQDTQATVSVLQRLRELA